MEFLTFIGIWGLVGLLHSAKTYNNEHEPSEYNHKSNNHEYSVVAKPITYKNCKMQYGSKNYLKFYGKNLFKMKSSIEIDSEDYAILDFEGLLYVRIYKNQNNYYSLDNKKWYKLEQEPFYYSKNNLGYIVVSNEIYELFKYVDTLSEMEFTKY